MKVGDCMLRGIILVGVLLAIGGAPALADSGGGRSGSGGGIYSPYNPPVPISPTAAHTYYGKYGRSLTPRQISHGAFAGGLKLTAYVGPSGRAGAGSRSGAWELAIVGVLALVGLAGTATLSRRTVPARRARAG